MAASSLSTTLHDQLHTLVADRTVVVATAHQAGGELVLRRLHELGAGRILVLGPPALAPLAAALDTELVEVDLGDADDAVTTQVWEALLGDPPSGLRNLLDARDPLREALVLVSPELGTVELLGRPVFGADRPGWDAYQDTVLAARLWQPDGDTQ